MGSWTFAMSTRRHAGPGAPAGSARAVCACPVPAAVVASASMKVLVIYKKSMYAIYGRERRDPRFLRLLRRKDPTVARTLAAHEEHQDTLAIVKSALREAGCEVEIAYRARGRRPKGHGLVVTVGGDGTLLEAARAVGETPILGVNSSPSTSLGFFAGAYAAGFPRVLREFLAGRSRPTSFTRMRVSVNGRALPVPVLNDVLFCHLIPAATTRYLVTVRGRTEEHRSSGIWFSTAAGSTAAIHSAGGRIMPVSSRRIQYLVREPFLGDGPAYRIERGSFGLGEEMQVKSKMRRAMIYLDGPHVRVPIAMGDVVAVRPDGPRLNLVAFDRRRRDRFAGKR